MDTIYIKEAFSTMLYSPPKHIVSAATIVVNEQNELLLIKGPRRGWEMPGGQVEEGESLEEAAIRETKEESGIDVEIIKFCGIYQNVENSICNSLFLARPIGGVLTTSSESLEVGFFPLPEALNKITLPNFRERVAMCLDESTHPFFVPFYKTKEKQVETFIQHSITIGERTTNQLLTKLEQNNILLNPFAETLLNDERFPISPSRYTINIVEVTVEQLGLINGATTRTLLKEAAKFKLGVCPLEAIVVIREIYSALPSSNEKTSGFAPDGSITIASLPLDNNDEFPKGFYIRTIDDEKWIRGYIADDLHVWKPTDRFILKKY